MGFRIEEIVYEKNNHQYFICFPILHLLISSLKNDFKMQTMVSFPSQILCLSEMFIIIKFLVSSSVHCRI